ncbi:MULTISPECIES: hypothetical protein [Sphingobacterium]|uniref:hypothetical protein n=1 Tax=Sphingobacterium TaxID=28453 RepID=UPI00257E93D1|nr:MULTISPECIES: hypothetical protein [Sphingobacterium]
MKKALTILILMCFVFLAKSQGDDSGNALYPNNFTVTNPAVLNNKIVIPFDYTLTTLDIKGSFGITVSGMYKPYFSDIKTSIAVMSGDQVIASADGPSFNRSDFTVGGVVYNNSTYKDFKLTINRGQTTGYQPFEGTTIVLRYKYYFNPAVGIPNQEKAGWAPEVTFGREWFKHDKIYPITISAPLPSINGPSSICDEANYSIINPGTVTLVDATNIALLSKLSESQWKITRTGTASGFVKLKSTSNGKTVEKEIIVGTPTLVIYGDGDITAPKGVGIQDATFGVDKDIPGATYEWHIIGSSRITFPNGNTGKTVIVHVKSHQGTIPYQCKMRLRITNSCGTSEDIFYNFTVIPTNGGGPIT